MQVSRGKRRTQKEISATFVDKGDLLTDNEIKAETRSHPTISPELGWGGGWKEDWSLVPSVAKIEVYFKSASTLAYSFRLFGLFCCHCFKNSCFVHHCSSSLSSVIQWHLALVSFEVQDISAFPLLWGSQWDSQPRCIPCLRLPQEVTTRSFQCDPWLTRVGILGSP